MCSASINFCGCIASKKAKKVAARMLERRRVELVESQPVSNSRPPQFFVSPSPFSRLSWFRTAIEQTNRMASWRFGRPHFPTTEKAGLASVIFELITKLVYNGQNIQGRIFVVFSPLLKKRTQLASPPGNKTIAARARALLPEPRPSLLHPSQSRVSWFPFMHACNPTRSPRPRRSRWTAGSSRPRCRSATPGGESRSRRCRPRRTLA